MDLNSNLPVLVPAVIGLIAVSAAAALALAWVKQPQVRRWVWRSWLAAAILIAGGVVIFWISTAMIQGPRRSTIDHSLQERQRQELQQRLRNGGH
jgi:small neutral amino acid transporter SnatA (MarC family)